MNIKQICLVSIFAAALPTVALADVAMEMKTAANHATMGSKAADLSTVHKHLHHVVNCLVGPAGAGFDATNANPCGKQGNGIIPDSTDAAQKAKAMTAENSAKSGLAATDLATAQKDAGEAATALGGM